MRYRIPLILLFTLALKTSSVSAQAGITGRLVLDTALWAPVLYLSHIPDLDQMHTISYRQIIAESEIRENGTFSFSTDLLPESDQFYRIHLVKKGDPPATLMIGGKKQNHFFLLAKAGSQIEIRMSPGKHLFSEMTFAGYGPNSSLQEIQDVIERLNAVDQVATSINREFTREVIYDQLRAMADSSQHPLIALYALHASDYKEHFPENPSFYRRFFRKWRHLKSPYFVVFRQQLKLDRSRMRLGIISGSGLVLVIVLIAGLYLRNTRKAAVNPYTDLTIQERKVFDMLKAGRSNKEIAEEFSVSVSTVKSHVNSIFSKLGVKSRRDLMDI